MLAIAPLYKEWFALRRGPRQFPVLRRLFLGQSETTPARFCSRAASSWAATSPRSCRSILPRLPNSSTIPGTTIPTMKPVGSIRSRAKPIPSTPAPSRRYEFLDVDKKYSWLKAPRYDGKPMEVGPLARMVVGYASGQKDIKAAVDGVLKKLNAPATVLFSTLGRIAARALEAQIMANQLEGWVDELDFQHGARQDGDLQSHSLGSGHLADRAPAATAGMRRRAARSATGWRSRANRSRTTRLWSPPPGTPVRATPRASAAPTKRRCLSTPIADPDAAAGNPAHDSFLRSLYRLRGARGRRQRREYTIPSSVD